MANKKGFWLIMNQKPNPITPAVMKHCPPVDSAIPYESPSDGSLDSDIQNRCSHFQLDLLNVKPQSSFDYFRPLLLALINNAVSAPNCVSYKKFAGGAE
jgi:hypothetical protein